MAQIVQGLRYERREMNQELSEGIQIIAGLLIVAFIMLAVACRWAEHKYETKYNDHGINKDARLK